MSETPKDLEGLGSDRVSSGGHSWADVKSIFEGALTLEASEWSAFLDLRCGSDESLRREVESLLVAHESDSDFLEEPVEFVKGLSALDPAEKVPRFEAGMRVGAYRLDREIGRGGMGAVYVAYRADEEFEQQVAIKLIRIEKHNELAIRRFRQERQILAKLEHPYIARLLDGGKTESGIPYFVMEFVEGEVLTRYCDSHGLTARERVELFVRVCSAVQYAHERQIIHRDLKPGNILVTSTGMPKLLDFGIAKVLQEEAGGKDATIAGFRMLTPAYASPEQMRGDPATIRSDVYSLGVVLYELLCGERPSLRAVQNGKGNPDSKEAHLSPRLRAIVFNAIRLDPDERYPSVRALSEDLERYLEGAPLVRSVPEPREKVSIGILPFREFGAEAKSDPFIRSALLDAIVTRLSKVDRLSVRPTSAVLKYAHRSDVVRAGRELRVQYILEGTLHTAGPNIRINAQLVSTETGVAIWASQFEESSRDLLSLEDSISEQIAYAVIPQLTGEEEHQLKRSGTANGRAHEAYLRGRFHWNRSAGEPEELAKALVYFTQAIAEDPTYAAAHAGVADYHLRMGLWGGLPPAESFAAGIEQARAALQLEPGLAEAHATLGFCLWAYNRDYSAAEREFQLAIAHNPDYASTHHWFGLLNSARNRPELALVNLERARKIDPNSPVIAAALGFVHYNARQYPQSLELLLNAARDLRTSAVLREMLTWTYLQLSDVDKAVQSARRAVELGSRSPAALAALARAEAAAGRPEIASAICKELNELQKTRYVSGYDLASVCLAAGSTSQAISELERAYESKDWWLFWIAVDPRWDSLRNEPRFIGLVRKTQPADTVTSAPVDNKRRSTIVLSALLASCLFVVALLATGILHVRKSAPPFSDPRFSKLTGDGTAGIAAISADARYVAYTTAAGSQTTLWLRDLRTRSSRRLLSFPGELTSLHFSQRRVAFETYPTLRPFERTLYALPIAGGAPSVLLRSLSGPATLSPDGTHVALVLSNSALQQDELWIKDLHGNEHPLLTTKYPERLSWVSPPAWSSDGTRIAYAVERPHPHGSTVSLKLVSVAKGETRAISNPDWLYVEHIAWAGDRGLALSAREPGSSFLQLWYVPLDGTGAFRIGSDVENYSGVSVSREPSDLVSVQVQTLSNIYVLPPEPGAKANQVTPGTGRYFDLAWTPDGHLLYASDSSGAADIWLMNADGSDAHQLTAAAGLNWGPAADPEGKFVAFHSNRSGTWQVWRADADGSHPVQITRGDTDSNWPEFTPDGKNIVFQHSDANGRTSIWKVPKDGGEAIRLSSALTTHPTLSPRDGTIAAWYSPRVEKQDWKLALFRPEGGDPIRVFDAHMPVTPESQLAWTPQGDGIAFLGVNDGVFNLWLQPLSGDSPRRLTSYPSGQIYSFDWSVKGLLAYSHGLTTSDVVMAHQSRKQ